MFLVFQYSGNITNKRNYFLIHYNAASPGPVGRCRGNQVQRIDLENSTTLKNKMKDNKMKNIATIAILLCT